jgi:putative Flp pilus-assembly TadE/G-like protein
MAVVLTIVLVVLIGITALTIDGGLLWVKYRKVRNANDAAALAAALSCANGEGQVAADGSADNVATLNVSDATLTDANVYTPDCDASSGTVRVQYEGTQDLMFGPAVGISSPRDVVGSATATWGGSGDASHVAPMMLNMNRLGTCNITNPPSSSLQEGVSQCVFYWNNNDIGNATWGLMNLDPYNNKGTQWYVPADFGCSGTSGNEIRSWLSAGYNGDLFLNPSGKTYVCAGTGFQTGPVDQGLENAQGQTYAFPVNNPAEQVDRNGTACPPPCTPDKYSIIGFAWLRLDYFLTSKKKDDALWAQHCSAFVRDSNSRCIVTTWMGFTTSVSSSGGGANFGVVSAWLSE